MYFVGIDVASKKHDCCIISSDGELIVDHFIFRNDMDGFNSFLKLLPKRRKNIKIGLEATGHYSVNLINFLQSNNLNYILYNPLYINQQRKANSLRKTKTDKSDAQFIAYTVFSDDSKPYHKESYHIFELKSLLRHRYRLIGYRSKYKISIRRLVTILFPELFEAVWSIHQLSCQQLLLNFSSAKDIASCHLTKLTNILLSSSKGKYGKEKATQLKQLAANSIGLDSPSISFELQQTIRLLVSLQEEIKFLDAKIKCIMQEINSPVLSIPGISYVLGAIIISEIGEVQRFSNPYKLLAFAGLEPAVHQSGNYSSTKTPMVKRGSKYLRWAILTAARTVSMRDKTFGHYLKLKRSQGKHFFVAISHVGKKLTRVIFHLLKNNIRFVTQS